MHILNAFNGMLGDLHYGDASDRQITGVLDWEDQVRRVVTAAETAGADTPDVTFAGAVTHRTWYLSAGIILRSLREQAADAELGRLQADMEADEEEQAARSARTRAGASEDPAETSALREEAGRHDSEAEDRRDHSQKLMDLQVAAEDAHTFGSAVVANEVPIAIRVGEGIAQAGGVSEVPEDKRYATWNRPVTAAAR